MEYDIDKIIALYLDGFPQDGERFARYFVTKQSKENISILRTNDEYISIGYIVEKRCELFGNELILPYFSALSTKTEHRGKGQIALVVKDLLKKAYKRKAPFVALSPFSPTFYKKFHFVDASYCGKTLVSGGINCIEKECGVDDFVRLYKEFLSGYTLKLLYGEEEFNELKSEIALYGKLSAFYAENSEAVAVVAYDDKNVFKYATKNGFALEKIENLKGKTIRDFSKDEKVFSQIRLVSAEEFFKSVKYLDEVSNFTVRLSDDIIEENNGVYSVSIINGEVTVEKLSAKAKIRAQYDFSPSELISAFLSGKEPFVKPLVCFQDEY